MNRDPWSIYGLPWTTIILLSLFSCSVAAQPRQGAKQLSKKQKKVYEQILDNNNRNNLGEALKGLNKLLLDAPDFTEGYHLRGSIYYDQGNYESAESDLEKVLKLEPDYDPLVIYQLALAEKRAAKYDEAVTHFEQFIAKGYKRESLIGRAQGHLEDARFAAKAVQKPVPFDLKNVGDPISSQYPEYLPLLSADGNSMIFTRRVGNQEDFYIGEKVNNEWTAVRPIAELNTPFNEGAQSVSADGRLMVFTFCQSGPDQGGCDLFYAEKCDGSWSKPKRIAGNINTKAWEAQPSLNADGSLLLFASDRPGGEGKRDIWASRRSRSGRWGNPVNLGPSINTKGDDQCPFLHADGRTFYLCSDGRAGMGGNDLYYVKLQDDGQWGTVNNLGYPINTPGNEGTLTVSLDGAMAFFAKSPKESLPGQAMDLDIFTFPLYSDAQPLPVTYVEGTIFDSKSGEKLSAEAELIDLDTGRPVARVRSCEDGSYLVCLPAGKNYALHVNKDGYLLFSEHFALASEQALADPFQLDAPLQLIEAVNEIGAEKSKPIILKNVFFASGSAELLPASSSELDLLADLLEKNGDLRIQLNGHTDDVGADQDNMALSDARAQAVYDYLLEKGIEKERLKYQGFGETWPIASNETEEGRQKNRRTEFEVW